MPFGVDRRPIVTRLFPKTPIAQRLAIVSTEQFSTEGGSLGVSADAERKGEEVCNALRQRLATAYGWRWWSGRLAEER
jgi:hypothetical protein